MSLLFFQGTGVFYFHGCSHPLQWFWAQEIKICHYFHCFPVYLPWSDGTVRCLDSSVLNVEFQAAFSLSSFTLIKRLFSSFSLSAIRLVSFACLRLSRLLLASSWPGSDSLGMAGSTVVTTLGVPNTTERLHFHFQYSFIWSMLGDFSPNITPESRSKDVESLDHSSCRTSLCQCGSSGSPTWADLVESFGNADSLPSLS